MIDKKSAKILVIDDEQGIRDLLSYELGAQGYGVVTACNGEEGIEKLKRDKFHLVISDVKMPKMDGVKTLEAIKRIDPDIEVIMATGFGNIEIAVAAMKKGAYDFIQKPFNLDEIMNLVEKALEKSELKALVILYETSKAIFSAVKLEQLFPILIDLSLKLLKADDVSIMLLGEDQKLFIAACKGCEDEIKKKVRLALGERVAGKVAEWRRSAILVGPLSKDSRFSDIQSRDEIKSSIICPLLSSPALRADEESKQEVLGVICMTRTQSQIPFNHTDLKHAHIFLSQIAQAIDNARLYRELEKKIEALKQSYAELSEIKDELVQTEKLASIGELASGVAHELNNPLTTIIGLVDLMIEEEGQPEETMQDFKTIKEQADRCRKIILNLLQFSRKQQFEMKVAQMNEIIEKTLGLLEYDLKSSGIEVVKELDRSIPLVKIDPNRIQQVFLNLINNARDALANRDHPKLVIRTENAKDKVKIYFMDNGCGIPETSLKKIFNPFFTTKQIGKGTGLGLSISFGIVKDFGGTIHVESKEGEGATFCVELLALI